LELAVWLLSGVAAVSIRGIIFALVSARAG
jgi:hypothetical protein